MEQIPKREPWLPMSAIFAVVIVGAAWVYTLGAPRAVSVAPRAGDAVNPGEVLPPGGVVLPVRFREIGPKLLAAGVISEARFREVYASRGGLSPETEAIFAGRAENVRMTPENAGELLNVLWAFGLANQNRVLMEGPMQDPRYGGPGGFASTGGWSLSEGEAMTHYSAHAFVALLPEAQARVERVAQGIYRPCCGNSTYFPDCNHGMAMLGLLELMAAQGASEDEMYRVALQVNAYWFPETYLTIAEYYRVRGVPWAKVEAREALGESFSSAGGYSRVRAEVAPPKSGGGGSCGV